MKTTSMVNLSKQRVHSSYDTAEGELFQGDDNSLIGEPPLLLEDKKFKALLPQRLFIKSSTHPGPPFSSVKERKVLN